MTLATLLPILRERRIRIWVEDGKLRYSAPKGALTPELKTALAEQKETLLTAFAAPAEPIARAPRGGPLPLSFAQQRLWLLEQLDPGSAVYNVPGAVRLLGRLDVEALRRSFEELVRRHESLRTTFSSVDGEPRQLIQPPVVWSLPIVSLEETAPAEREREIKRHAAAEARRPFALESGPLLRTTLLRMGDREHVLLLTMHHIASDGWSEAILIDELAALYPAYRDGRPSPLPELALQYADFAAWQRSPEQERILARQSEYWRDRLRATAPLELPIDRPRPPVQTSRGALVTRKLSPALADAIRRLGQQHEATTFMTLLAAFDVLLSRSSGQTDICVGTPIANRTRKETEPLIGFFVNTLVIRVDLSGEPTFLDVLARVREASLGAYAHQEVPFERLVAELEANRDLSRHPLFQVLFVLQNAPERSLALPELTLRPVDVETEIAKFDLSLSIAEEPEGFACGIEYNVDLFDRATVERLLGHFEAVLRAVTTEPRARVPSLALLTDAERRHLLLECNDTRRVHPDDACIHQLFERQVARTPNAVALQAGEVAITYAELDGRANRLARHLRARGVGVESLVGVCLERSVDMVVALLAILKAGGAYVPLDPDYPRDRLRVIADDARLSLIVTHSALVSRVDRDVAQKLLLDAEAPAIAAQDDRELPSAASAQACAYVIYTSGSTGAPKGVAIAHRSAVTFLRWACRAFRPDELEGVLAVTSICFDLSIFELFAPLSCGGAIILARDALDLQALRSTRPVTLLNTVPSAMREWLRLDVVPGTARTVNLAGEPLTRALAAQVYELPNVTRLCNLYGPTEDTTYSTIAEVTKDDPRAPAIGVPIDNGSAYVLDARLELVPIGTVGELWLAGDGLARGYLGKPALTADRFRPDPFAEGGRRMYRTGDLARRRHDGTLECLGRVDFQVKVRGFRIELPEIEAKLLEHPGVGEVAILARSDAHGDKYLAAYWVAKDETAAADALREHLAARLPGYMVPAAYVRLDALPSTANGKLDRNALPSPDASAYATAPFEAPRGDVETALAEIWTGVLSHARIGRDDNFFALGGHSLLATQVVSRIRDRLHATVSLRAFFEAPTVAGLARVVRTTDRELAPAGIPLSDRSRRLPLSFAQRRLWFLDQLEPDSAAYNLSLALRLRGELDPEALRRALGEIVRRHESLRTTFRAEGGEPFQVVHPPATWPLPVADVGHLAPADRDAELGRLAASDARQPFSLESGPLLRTSLVRVDHSDHLLLVAMHHIVSDGWSLGIFGRELGALYAAFLQGQPPAEPPPTIQYADFAAWQETWQGGPDLAYWTQQLEATPLLDLPTDRPRPREPSARGATFAFSIDAPRADRLRRFARAEGATVFMTMLAAFKALLIRYTRQPDVAVGTPIANRTRSELEPLIGCFVNTLVLRTDLSGEPSFREAVARVKSVALDAYAHQDAPFEKVVEAVAPVRDRSRTPLFQVMFAVHNAGAEMPSFPGIDVSVVDGGDVPTQFELSLDVIESSDGTLACSLTYGADLFESTTIARMSEHYRALLASAVESPDASLSTLPLMTDAERQRVLLEWNQTSAPLPDLHIHELFEARARAVPEATAVEMGAERWSYGELDARSEAIATRLCALGIGETSRVALAIERSPQQLAALFGILKAGAAYVPIDSKLPRERKAWMVTDARVDAIVVRGEAPDWLPSDIATLDVRSNERSMFPTEARHTRKPPAESPAYLLYTSGSTGRPKGVLVSHRNLVNHTTAMARRFALTPSDRVLQFATISFDAAAEEIFPTLMVGGTLVLRGEEDLSHEALAKLAPTVLDLPTAYWHAWIGEMLDRDARVPESLRLVILGGEEARYDRFAQWMKLGGASVHFINTYGPTEATISATAFTLAPGTTLEQPVIPIGRPIENVTTYVLDEHRAPVPIGVPGELWIGGEGVALGYFDRPELTRERFVPNPFGPGRLYRTGDLVRWSAGGQLEFLGRVDSQIKIRGYRIELGEIESALRAEGTVRDAVVIAREVAGDRRLAAYVVPNERPADRGARTALATTLRACLASKLPSYLVPPDIVVLDALPMTTSQKVDRRALPPPEPADVEPSEASSPRDALELRLVAIWEELLGRAPIGIRESFFDLGGHSLLAVRLMARLRAELGRDLPLATLFELGTVERLAQLLRATRYEPVVGTLVAIQPNGSRPPLFCVHPAGGNVLCFAALARALGRDQPLYGLQSAGLAVGGKPDETVEAMAERYVRALRERQPRGPYHLLGYSAGGTIAYAMATKLRTSGEAIASLTLLDAPAPSRLAEESSESPIADFAREHGLALDDAELGVLGEDAALARVLRCALDANVVPPDVDLPTLRRLLLVMTSNVRAACTYLAERCTDVPVTLLRAGEARDVDAAFGWKGIVDKMEIHWIGGDHASILAQPLVARVAQHVAESMARQRPRRHDAHHALGDHAV